MMQTDHWTEPPPIPDRAIQLAVSSRAQGTNNIYNRINRQFETWCLENNYKTDISDIRLLTAYILYLKDTHAPISTFKTLGPALNFHHKLTFNSTNSATNCHKFRMMIDGIIRTHAVSKPDTKKMAKIDRRILELFTNTCMLSNMNISNIKHWRLGIRMWTEYLTFCRYNCYSSLKVKHVKLLENSTKILFPRGKTDQKAIGKSTFIPTEDSVFCYQKLIRHYINFLGGEFYMDGESFLNCQVSFLKGKLVPNPKKTLSYASSVAELKKGMGLINLNPSEFGEKSAKIGGVSKAIEQGLSLDAIRRHGRWASELSVLHYEQNSHTAQEHQANEFKVI